MAEIKKSNLPEIKGFVPNSLVDWDGKVASTIFLPGCNFKCGFCSNSDLVMNPDKLENVSWRDIEAYLVKSREFIDGVVITGGEPTIHQDIKELCSKIKQLGFKVKIDTNGSNPEMLKNLISEKLVDYIAMDIKTSLEKYQDIIREKINIEKIKESINIISKFGDYEFRTTVFPGIEKQDLVKIADYLKKNKANKRFMMQQFRNDSCLDKEFESKKPYSRKDFDGFLNVIKPFFEESNVRNI